jgi:hypothetical protein
MNTILKSPICNAYWTKHCFIPDRKYLDRNSVGVFSIVGNFNPQGRNELEKLILSHIGNDARGTYYFKSDSRGNTDVKFKAKEKIKDKNGNEVIQKPPVFYNNERYEGHFEYASVRIFFTPKLFKAYNKCSLILKAIEILEFRNTDPMGKEDEAILKVLGVVNGNT